MTILSNYLTCCCLHKIKCSGIIERLAVAMGQEKKQMCDVYVIRYSIEPNHIRFFMKSKIYSWLWFEVLSTCVTPLI